MYKGVYLFSAAPKSGKFFSIVGFLDVLLGKGSKAAYFKPIADKSDIDKINSLRSYFSLPEEPEEMIGVFSEEVAKFLAEGRKNELLDLIFEKYKNLEKSCDFVLVDGVSIVDGKTVLESFEFNKDIVSALSLPLIDILDGEGETLESVEGILRSHEETFKGLRVERLLSIVNKVSDADFIKKPGVVCLPYQREMEMVSVEEIKEQLSANVVYGEEFLGNAVGYFLVCAMQLDNMLSYLKEDNAALVVPFDRSDVLLGSVSIFLSKTYPSIKAVVISGKGEISENVKRVFNGLKVPFPILQVADETYKVALRVKEIDASQAFFGIKKFDAIRTFFRRYVSAEQILDLLLNGGAARRSPRVFLHELAESAKKKTRRIVLPEGGEPRVLRAAESLLQRSLVKIVLLGEEKKIREKAKELDVDLKGAEIIEPTSSSKFSAYCEEFYQLRKSKGMTPEAAKDVMSDVNYFGTMMVYKGDADGMVSGSVHSTAETIRPALQIIKTTPESPIISSVFIMCLEDRILIYGDCAVNPTPTAEQLASIAIDSEKTARRFGVDPRVALLSYSTGNSGSGEEVDKVKEALRIVRERAKDMIVDGPIQYDAAVSKEVGLQKMPGSKVAGNATVLIFPDLNTGNNTYKAVQRETNCLALGPVLQGLRKPVNDLSRGCSVEDIINTVLVTAAQCE